MDFLGKLDKEKESVPGILGGVAGTLPVGLAVYYANRKLQSNTPINVSQLLRSNSALANLGKDISTGLHKSYEQESVALNKVTEQFMKSDTFTKMMGEQSQRNALIQSLLSTMEDPSAGFNEETLRTTREKLLQIAGQNVETEEARDIVKAALTSIQENSSDITKKRFDNRLREFRKIGRDLTVSSVEFKASTIFNPIEHAGMRDTSTLKQLTKGHAGRAEALSGAYNKLMAGLGTDAQKYVELASVGTGLDQEAVIARVFSGSGVNRRYQTTLTLLSDRFGVGGPQLFPTGEFAATKYVAPLGYVGGAKVEEMNRTMGPGGWGYSDLQGKGGLRPIAERDIDIFHRYVKKGQHGPFLTRAAKTAMNNERSEVMLVAPRLTANSQGNLQGVWDAHRRHLAQSYAEQSNYIVIDDLQRYGDREKEGVMIGSFTKRKTLNIQKGAGKLTSNRSFDAGGSRLSRLVEGRQHGTLRVKEGGAIDMAKLAFPVNRINMPVISRAEQITGRDNMFTTMGQSVVRKSGRHSTYDMGAQVAPIGWRKHMTGGINKVGVFDLTMGAGQGFLAKMEGVGEGFVMGDIGSLLSSTTIPILDPKLHGNQSTELFEFIHKQGGGVFSVTSDGRLKHAGTGKEFGRALGMSSSGMREVHLDPRTRTFRIDVAEMTQAYGKNVHNLTINAVRDMETAKVFGWGFKGTLTKASFGVLDSRAGESYGFDAAARTALNIADEDVFYASGDQFKKGAAIFQQKLEGALGLVTKLKDPTKYLKDQMIGKTSSFGGAELGVSADIVMQTLSKSIKAGHTTVAQAGYVFSGIYHASGLAGTHAAAGRKGVAPTKAYYGSDSPFAFDVEALDKRARAIFGDTTYDSLLKQKAVRQGMMVAPEHFRPGTGHGDYGFGRGSVEPRLLELTSMKLRSAGMSHQEVSEFMIDIMKRKIGGEEGMKVVRPLENMMTAALGMTLPHEVPKNVLTIQDVQSILTKHKTFGDYLTTQKEDVFLDLASLESKEGAAISHAAGEVFGGQRMLRFSGSNAMELMKGPQIKQAAGLSIEIGSAYVRAANDFALNLNNMATDNEQASKEAIKNFSDFRKNIANLYATAVHGQAKGKIKGSVFGVSESYVTATKLLDTEDKVVSRIMGGTRGQAVFGDSHHFLGALSDYMGDDRGEMARRFFTGSEGVAADLAAGGKGSIRGGIYTLTTRNPNFFLRSTNITQMFRHVQEVGKGQSDNVWSALRASKSGQAAIDELSTNIGGKTIGGFGDVATLEGQDQHVSKFFRRITRHQSDWWHTQGGGSIYYPKSSFDIKTSGAGKLANIKGVDFGFQGAAFGDADGDWTQTMLLSREQRMTLKKHLSDPTKAAKYFEVDANVVAKQKLYDEYLKQGMTHQLISSGEDAATAGDIIQKEFRAIGQDWLKENAQERQTGSVNNAFDKVRKALQNIAGGQDDELVREAMNLFSGVPELTTIKNKKLVAFFNNAQQASTAVDRAFQGEGANAIFDFLENVLLPRKHMEEIYTGVDYSVSGGGMNVNSAKGNIGIDKLRPVLQRAIENYNAIGGGPTDTLQNMERALGSGSRDEGARIMQDFLAATSGTQAGMASAPGRAAGREAQALAEGAWTGIRAAAGKVDGKMAGLITLGLGAGAAIVGMAGADGYDSSPLMAPSDMPSAYVQKGIGSFNLLDSSPARQSGQPMSDPYDMINTPVNTGTTYMSRPNGYNIRGEIGNMSGVGRVGSYLSTLTRGFGRGSITVNDTRRPITSSYVDKMSGEY